MTPQNEIRGFSQDEIIGMARQISNTPLDATSTPDLFGVKQIEAFAKLVAAKEREACAVESENCGAIHVAKRIRARGEA